MRTRLEYYFAKKNTVGFTALGEQQLEMVYYGGNILKSGCVSKHTEVDLRSGILSHMGIKTIGQNLKFMSQIIHKLK